MNFKRAALDQKPRHIPQEKPIPPASSQRVSVWMKVALAVFIVALVGGAATIVVMGSNVYNFVNTAKDDPLKALLDVAGTPLLEDSNERTNILLLGSGGLEHDGGSDLTDTIMVASIDHQKNHVTLISLPRDLVVYVPQYKEYHRINTLFTLGHKRLGESQKDELIRTALENALCLDIHYYAKIDFSGFMKAIDALGGIDVEVEKQFTDYSYPTKNYGYQTIHFDAGLQHMTGEQALQYSRSRHGTNGEASDFARAARQQRVIQGVWETARNKNLFSNPKQLEALISTVNQHYETDMRIKEAMTLAGIGKSLLAPPEDANLAEGAVPVAPSISEKVTTIVLNDGPEGLLYTPTEEVRAQYYGGAFVLLPDGDNFDTICAYVNRILGDPVSTDFGPQIEVLNGSGKSFLARDVGAYLVKEGFDVQRRDNTFQQRKYPSTYIYDHSRGGNIAALTELEKLLGGEIVGDNTEPVFFSDIDITIVLGEDFVMPEGALGAPTMNSERVDTVEREE